MLYYSYSALGTDRYPPFTLAAVDYPATFDVAHPERLSRGLVLVKCWRSRTTSSWPCSPEGG